MDPIVKQNCPIAEPAAEAAPAPEFAGPRAIVVRDRVSLGRPEINTDFLYSPFKAGRSVFGASVQPTGQTLHRPFPPNMQVAPGLPMELRLLPK